MTVNTLVQGAWALVLARHTGQTKVVFGATVAGRPSDLEGVESLVGLFINTLPVVVEVKGAARLGAWLRSVQRQAVASQEHAQTPLQDIQRFAGASSQALFDSVVVFENYPVDSVLSESRPRDLRIGGLAIHEKTNYPLTIAVTQGDTLELQYKFTLEHFDIRTISRIADHVTHLLTLMLDASDRSIGELDLLSDMERREQLSRARDEAPQPNAEPVHGQFHAQARRRPDATAVLFGDVSVSYAALDARSNRLAHRLVKLGVRPEVRVGIAVERSVEMVVGLLAILKAGGAYVPLDPEYPGERLSYMMEDSGIGLLLTQSHLRNALPLPAGLQVIELDTLDVSGEPPTAPPVNVHGENLAYVIYTSGSTGRPKGVAVAHGALSMHCRSIGARYELEAGDRLLQFASISFDAAQEQWLLPLLVGATTVLRDAEMWSAQRLVSEIREKGITVLYLPPAYIDAFAREVCAGEASVRACIVGGEGWAASGFRAVQERLRPRLIFNAYGPAETVITPTVWIADESTRFDSAYAPVGRSVGDRTTYVLDSSMNLTMQGVTGELYIGGSGLARSYLNRPGLSAERFVPDPFDEHGGRLYRTGDLVRWNERGVLEYQGRLDHQVKIRGFRIELGEIEAQLRAQAGVREAVVMARPGPGGMRLIGYVTAAQAKLDVADLRSAVARVLPDYMVPSIIVELEAFPLGHAALDAELPGGGWPTGSLT
ncbi:amino acid adenylation domain-containing protein, partial [Paraburkholderia tropica]|uniref:amino acid adenylation domain-containing protein n=1 Tax=Paraburkholderia tropica TaxID=92647 RepID=UPI0022B22EB8